MDIPKEIESIKQRNQKAEADKAWEQSWARRMFIVLITYVAAAIWLIWIGEIDPWLKALVPALAYIFSTLTLPPLKRWWVNKNNKISNETK